ncbi:antitoxin [Anoxybacillus flavithermus]|uniref:antitoxin n=1 Tax=Anoxybacillus flavithermus TaxID=33934 RepID=UPI0018675CBA|nr:antitoxin [Anoxybacillus flavithermus]MBE2914151.1 antitoxin [Anoxybacillus flavithermus]
MSSNIRKAGRPPGRKKTSKIEILLEPEVKEQFMNCLRIEGKCASTEIGNWIREYIKKVRE